MEGASQTSSLVSLLKTIVGAGLLSMPLAFSTDGVPLGIGIVLLAAGTAAYGLFLQAYVSQYVAAGHASFFNVCQLTYPALSVVFDLAIAVQCFGCAISYLVLIADLMPTVAPVSFVAPAHLRLFWLAALALVCVPLSFLKNLDSLKYSSVLGLGAIGYLCVLVVANYLASAVPPELRGDVHVGPQSLRAVCLTFSIIVFAFTGHQNMFSIINEARDRSLVALLKLVVWATAAAATLFIAVGLCGYLTFGDRVGGNVVLLYPHVLLAVVGRLSIVFVVVVLFPLMIHPARISVNNIYYWCRTRYAGPELQPLLDRRQLVPFPHTTFCAITTALLVVGYFAAATLKSFALVLAVVGATGLTAISFILPGLFGYKLIGSETDVTSLERILKACSAALAIWGMAVMVVCLYSSLALS